MHITLSASLVLGDALQASNVLLTRDLTAKLADVSMGCDTRRQTAPSPAGPTTSIPARTTHPAACARPRLLRLAPFPQQQLTVLHRASLLWQVGLSKNLTQTLASQKEGPVGTFAW